MVWADFLSPDHVLTVNRAGVLVLWSLPSCKAVYVTEGACEGAPVLSPGRTYLAAYQGGTFRFLNPNSGELRGRGPGAGLGVSPARPTSRDAAFQADGTGLVALIGGQQVVRWDLATGKVTADFPIPMTISPGPNSHHAVIESCGANHVLLDGRILVDLEKRSHIWSYFGPSVSAGGPDGRHWYVAGIHTQNASSDSAGPPRRKCQSRGGHGQRSRCQTVAPSRDAGRGAARTERPSQEQRRLSQGHHRQPERQAEGQRHDRRPAGARSQFIVHVEEKNTGRKVDYREFGDAHFSSPRGSIAITNLVCDVQFADGQGGRIPLAPQQSFGMLQGFRMVYRLPPGETLESYLKNNQWNAVKHFVSGIGLPYFVARQADGVVMLPGSTDLNAVR